MKTLTFTVKLSDQAAANLAEHAAENSGTADDLVARLIEGAYDDAWFADLSLEDRAAIEEGMAQADRGETIPHDEVVASLARRHGW